MTLVEILISLTIIGFVLTAIYAILFMQQRRAVQSQQTTVLQTDAQVAWTLFKWDLYMGGIGVPAGMMPVQPANSNAGPDAIILLGPGFAFEIPRIKWSILIEDATGGVMQVVKRWGDARDFVVGDRLIVLDPFDKKWIYRSLGILTVAQTESLGPDKYRITVNPPNFSSLAGNIAYSAPETLRYFVQNNTLFREFAGQADIFLENVEDLQFAYGFDTDGDAVVDTFYNDFITEGGITDPSILHTQPFRIRATLVVRSENRTPGYNYPYPQLQIEDHQLTFTDRSYPRMVLSGEVMPRNLFSQEAF